MVVTKALRQNKKQRSTVRQKQSKELNIELETFLPTSRIWNSNSQRDEKSQKLGKLKM